MYLTAKSLSEQLARFPPDTRIYVADITEERYSPLAFCEYRTVDERTAFALPAKEGKRAIVLRFSSYGPSFAVDFP